MADPGGTSTYGSGSATLPESATSDILRYGIINVGLFPGHEQLGPEVTQEDPRPSRARLRLPLLSQVLQSGILTI
jgi:hypothetical protein